jgi:hypothetical protein
MNLLRDLNNELDTLLKIKPWTEKEYNLYKLLENYTVKFRDNNRMYLINKNDKPNIIENCINNNPNFFNRPVLNNLMNTLYIEKYISTINTSLNYLFVKIKFSDFYFIIKSKTINGRIKQTIKIYNIYNNNEKYIINLKDKKLNFNVLNNIMHYKGAKLTNDEIFMIITEILLYYQISVNFMI